MPVARPQPRKESTPVTSIDERIRLRAFELFEQRGREDGHDLEDWLRAESEVAGRSHKLASLTVVK
ncbi:MAG TPA: DUF2934 domain-containing protein [Terriglobales bacterium]|nr:DUF2934 domain-containing protein [Terriglobales bacterium]